MYGFAELPIYKFVFIKMLNDVTTKSYQKFILDLNDVIGFQAILVWPIKIMILTMQIKLLIKVNVF